MILTLNMTSDLPIYQQIRNQIILALATGQLKPGESLPSVRQLADDIGVNMMTVSKAYQSLKEEGVVEMDRRQGTKIKENISTNPNYLVELTETLELLFAQATLNGISEGTINDLTKKIYLTHQRKDE